MGWIGAAVGAAGGLFGSLSKNAMIRKQKAMINEKKKENQAWYDRRYNDDATQRADAQRLLTLTEESIKKRNKAAAGTAAVMGGTDESIAATKEANSHALADATSQIAASAEQRKNQIEQQYLQKKDIYDQQLMNLEAQKQSVLGSVIGGAASGMASMV